MMSDSQEDWIDALAVAMAIVPTAYSRNKMFAFYKKPEVRRARDRSRAMRSLARELAGRLGRVSDIELVQAEQTWTLRYKIPSVRLGRSAELTNAELACVVHLIDSFGAEAKWAPPLKGVLEMTLARLPNDLRPTGS
jgi:hypothetical protein